MVVQHTSPDQQALAELRAREIEAAEAGDVETLLMLRTDDFVAMPPGHPPVVGLDNVRPFLQGMFAQMAIEEDVVSESLAVDGDLAYDRGYFTGTATPRAGGESIALDGKYLWIARRQERGAWKYVVQMWSDNVAPDAG